MGSHAEIRQEATEVAVLKLRPPRNPAKERAPWITEKMIAGVGDDGKVAGYASGGDHKGTFYREFEGTTKYPDEDFVRVVIYGDETFDIETRIPAAHFRALVGASAAAEIERLSGRIKIEVAAERERCAKLCDDRVRALQKIGEDYPMYSEAMEKLDTRIRVARGCAEDIRRPIRNKRR